MGYPDVHIVMVLLYVGLSGVGTVTTPAVSTGKAVPVSLSDGKYTTVICWVSVAGSIITGRIFHIYLYPLHTASFQISAWVSVSGKYHNKVACNLIKFNFICHGTHTVQYKEFDLV